MYFPGSFRGIIFLLRLFSNQKSRCFWPSNYPSNFCPKISLWSSRSARSSRDMRSTERRSSPRIKRSLNDTDFYRDLLMGLYTTRQFPWFLILRKRRKTPCESIQSKFQPKIRIKMIKQRIDRVILDDHNLMAINRQSNKLLKESRFRLFNRKILIKNLD